MRVAAAKILPPLALIAVPLIAFANMSRIGWSDGSFAADFGRLCVGRLVHRAPRARRVGAVPALPAVPSAAVPQASVDT